MAVYNIDYKNRIVSSFDAELGYSDDRNVGDVDVQGFDAQMGRRFGICSRRTVAVGYTKSTLVGNLSFGLNQFNQMQFLPLNGKQLVETPDWTYSARLTSTSPKTSVSALQGKTDG